MRDICYRELVENEINITLLAHFNRYQDVQKCWRKIDGEWQLKDIKFIDQWTSADYQYIITSLQKNILRGGSVLGAFINEVLVGFASVENELFGVRKDYVNLSFIHVSYDYRGLGIGKELFDRACKSAESKGARKLYISAHSAEETQAFYKTMGCVEAAEYNKELAEIEPFDVQMERSLHEAQPI